MTMPHLMNCEHQPDGRCPACDPTPSKAARRAAEAIWQTHDADGPPEAIAEIIERETGAGEAVDLLKRILTLRTPGNIWSVNPSVINKLEEDTRSFLQRFNQD